MRALRLEPPVEGEVPESDALDWAFACVAESGEVLGWIGRALCESASDAGASLRACLRDSRSALDRFELAGSGVEAAFAGFAAVMRGWRGVTYSAFRPGMDALERLFGRERRFFRKAEGAAEDLRKQAVRFARGWVVFERFLETGGYGGEQSVLGVVLRPRKGMTDRQLRLRVEEQQKALLEQYPMSMWQTMQAERRAGPKSAPRPGGMFGPLNESAEGDLWWGLERKLLPGPFQWMDAGVRGKGWLGPGWAELAGPPATPASWSFSWGPVSTPGYGRSGGEVLTRGGRRMGVFPAGDAVGSSARLSVHVAGNVVRWELHLHGPWRADGTMGQEHHVLHARLAGLDGYQGSQWVVTSGVPPGVWYVVWQGFDKDGVLIREYRQTRMSANLSTGMPGDRPFEDAGEPQTYWSFPGLPTARRSDWWGWPDTYEQPLHRPWWDQEPGAADPFYRERRRGMRWDDFEAEARRRNAEAMREDWESLVDIWHPERFESWGHWWWGTDDGTRPKFEDYGAGWQW